ncbi:MAG: hypothetical protein SAK29_38535 [Scytonema sp. PMC 1069.18]|nr:hypothetical protein [Scytonema sp. PMC 1069.18]MEC4884538.1 hypothetical protein [Scytonema sp. PMC 1070.18]
MASVINDSTSFELRVGSRWSSFEKFRTEGAKSLESIKNGTIAILQTKTGQYRILEEHDFQKMLGLARDVDRLRRGARVLSRAVRVVQKHRDTDTLNLLLEAVTMLGTLPELPTCDRFEPLLPEDTDADIEDDEVDLDPDSVTRPLDTKNAT